ncbi:MAG: hypothetical protein L6R41_006039 [Letrouitia leprolyta]|nr:MAG: hypothetical protein L6R41_006039 [Letrouitia leprolyta]
MALRAQATVQLGSVQPSNPPSDTVASIPRVFDVPDVQQVKHPTSKIVQLLAANQSNRVRSISALSSIQRAIQTCALSNPPTKSFTQAPSAKHSTFPKSFGNTHPKAGRTKPSTVTRENWQIQKEALLNKFGSTGWAPRKRLSPDALEGIRALHAQYPDKYTTSALADQFEVPAEAIRRILKSKWRPHDEEATSRRQRWDRRGERIWSKMVALGVKPPKKWREVSSLYLCLYNVPLLYPRTVLKLRTFNFAPLMT